MAKYIFKRILTAIPLIIVITILCFSLIHLAPYDAIDAMTTPKMSPEMVQMIREKYGYDQPVYVQYIRWLEGILNGNFGYSIVTKTNIFDELATRIPNTIKLVLPSYLTAYVISIVLGLVAGSHKNKWLDKLIDGICSLWIAMPTFWVAMLFIYLFGYKLRILPILGMHTVGVNTLSDFLLHFITPYLVLTLAFIPDNVRYVRSSTITQYSEDYVMVHASQIKDLELKLLPMQDKLSDFLKIQAMRDDCRQKQSNLSEKKTIYNQQEKELKQYMAEIGRDETTLQSQKAELSRLETKMFQTRRTKQKILSARQKIYKVENSCEERRNAIKLLQSKQPALSLEIADLEKIILSEVSAIESALSTVGLTESTLEKEIRELAKKIDAIEQQIRELERLIAAVRKQVIEEAAVIGDAVDDVYVYRFASTTI